VLGQLLLASGAITQESLNAALAEQRNTRERLGELLIRRGADPEAIARALAAQLRLEYVAPPLRPEAAALRLVNSKLAGRLRVIPLCVKERTLRMAMADPFDATAIDDLQFQTGHRLEPVVASAMSVDAALAAYHAGEVEAIATRIPRIRSGPPEAESETPDVAALRRASEAAPVVALVEAVLTRAVQAGASDVHIEPAGHSLRVRARIDGVLRELFVLPAHAAGAFASRVKVMADMDISVKRRPQDGRASVRVEGRELGLRVSTLPSQGGEKIVVRVLDPVNAGRNLDELGFDAETLGRFTSLLEQSHGVILVTGPTGSGKTTTLYAALSRLDRRTRNIITLEDPIEYRLEGLTQVQVHKRAGLGFASALRAVLRQDPDVIMVGELRDRETVETAMAAAMTGHLVLSTVHTNDSPSAATRLTDMGAAPYLIAAGLIGVLAQRLVRRLCRYCAAEHSGAAPAAEFGWNEQKLLEAKGCHRCDGTGYRGRAGVFELMIVDSRIRELLARRAPVDVLREAALAGGMEPLAQDAWRKVHLGLSSLAEVRPLLGPGAHADTRCPQCAAVLRPSYRACVQCGMRIRPSCECGVLLDSRWRHCPRCGKRAVQRVRELSRSQSSPAGEGTGAEGAGLLTTGASLRAEA
jgi:type IV pilus assembly protein PilB